MDVSLFDFDLPEERIALRPALPRDSARMMVVHRDGRIEHRRVRDLPDYVSGNDAIVVNDTRVFRARMRGVRLRDTGSAKIELLLYRRIAADRYIALARPAKKIDTDDVLIFEEIKAQVIRRQGAEVEVRFERHGADLDAAIAEIGEVPLPPYIASRRQADARDKDDYQTMFARQAGSVAAPTAGLHFTPELASTLKAKGVAYETLTLHIGLGTFLPVTASDTADHDMHPEHARLEVDVATRLNMARKAGGRILAIGTTSLRALESAASAAGEITSFDGETRIFITPGYKFRATDMLMTNFHLPRSTLFMLVCAFSGMGVMKDAYAQAIRLGYRFYSYGDACLLMGTQ